MTKRILIEADEIIGTTDESRSGLYGRFSDCMDRAAKIASVSTGKNIETKDMYLILIALKLAREAHCHKRDNLLDIAGYVGGLQEFYNEQTQNGEKGN